MFGHESRYGFAHLEFPCLSNIARSLYTSSMTEMPLPQPNWQKPEGITFNDDNSVLLPLPTEAFDMTSLNEYAESQGMEAKPEYNMTVIGRRKAEELVESFAAYPGGPDAARDFLQHLATETDWSFRQTAERYHLAKDYPEYGGERRESLVQMTEMPGLATFYQRLNEAFGTNLAVPVPHITTHSKITDEEMMHRGIGVHSADQLQELIAKKL